MPSSWNLALAFSRQQFQPVANVKEDTACGKNVTLLMEDDVLREESTMGKHLDPLEKELLIKRYLSNPGVKLRDFCDANNVSDGAFKKWLKQYKEQGIEGLARADDAIREILPDGVERTTENYKREILKLRIENERLKKNYTVRRTKDGEQEYIRLKPKNTR